MLWNPTTVAKPCFSCFPLGPTLNYSLGLVIEIDLGSQKELLFRLKKSVLHKTSFLNMFTEVLNERLVQAIMYKSKYM